MTKVRVQTCRHLGDHVVLSGAVHYFKQLHPNYEFDIITSYSDIFARNPDFGCFEKPDIKINVDYRRSGLDERRGEAGNLLNGFMFAMARALKVEDPYIDNSRVCYLPDPISDIPTEWKSVVVMNANCQSCSSVKLYPYWQHVVDMMPDVNFALIGGTEARDIQLPIVGPNVINLRGQTSYQQLFRLVKEARCVVSPPSGVVHVSSAYATPCVCVTGASEPTTLTDYPNVLHVTSTCHGHTNTYDANFGCRHFRTTDARSCENIVTVADRPYAGCMECIKPEDIMELVRRQMII